MDGSPRKGVIFTFGFRVKGKTQFCYFIFIFFNWVIWPVCVCILSQSYFFVTVGGILNK